MRGLKPLFLTAAWLHLATSAPLSTGHQNQIRWVNCSENVPSTLNSTGVDLANLPPQLHCGQISVPMDYDRPQGPNNTITLNLAMIRPSCPKGALFVNLGGSDPVAVLAWQVALQQTEMFSNLSDYYDIMFMDLRGTYGSNPISVSLDSAAGVPHTYPQNESDFNAFKQATATFFQSWIDNSSPPGIIQFVSTKEVIQDYEQIRQALGYEKINFLGGSYGTYRGQKYALTYSNRLDEVALGAGIPVKMSLFERAQNANDTSCPFYSQGVGSVPKVVHSIFENPPCSDPIPALDLQAAVSGLLANDVPLFPLFLQGLQNALSSNCSTLLGDQTLTVDSVVAVPLECGDMEYNKMTYEQFKSSLDAGLAALDQTGTGMNAEWQLQLYCTGWPFPAAALTSERISHKMLLVTADFDNDAPTEWTSYIWENQAQESTLVVRAGDGHVSFQFPDEPSTLITKKFLRTGKLPEPRDESLGTLVSVYSPGMRRPAIPSPYQVPTGPEAGDIDD